MAPVQLEWIAVTERLPAAKGRYLIHAPSADPENPLINVSWYDPDEGWLLVPYWREAITHWAEVRPPADCSMTRISPEATWSQRRALQK